jgi:hypothetical protein
MQERVVREIRMLRAMWRALETDSRSFLNGHEGGNAGYSQGTSYGFTRHRSTLPGWMGFSCKHNNGKLSRFLGKRSFQATFLDNSIFPEGTSSFDCALIMRNIQHQRHAANDLYLEPASQNSHSAGS